MPGFLWALKCEYFKLRFIASQADTVEIKHFESSQVSSKMDWKKQRMGFNSIYRTEKKKIDKR